jgi:hypothetical protein
MTCEAIISYIRCWPCACDYARRNARHVYASLTYTVSPYQVQPRPDSDSDLRCRDFAANMLSRQDGRPNRDNETKRLAY